MAYLDLEGLALFPALALVALVVRFGIFAGLFAGEPGGEGGGWREMGLNVADYLGGGQVGWFVNCLGAG